jgi:hypothetical protein
MLKTLGQHALPTISDRMDNIMILHQVIAIAASYVWSKEVSTNISIDLSFRSDISRQWKSALHELLCGYQSCATFSLIEQSDRLIIKVRTAAIAMKRRHKFLHLTVSLNDAFGNRRLAAQTKPQ